MHRVGKDAMVVVALVFGVLTCNGSKAFGRKHGLSAALDDVADVPSAFQFRENAFTSHQCHGQSFSRQEWKSRSCYYQNICFDTAEVKFKYFRAPAEGTEYLQYPNWMPKSDDYFEGPNFPQGVGRGLMGTDLMVSLGPISGMGDMDTLRFMPDVVDGPIPHDAVYDETSPLFLLYMSYNAHNIGHLMLDELLPWFSLMQAFGFETGHMQPLSLQYPDGPILDSLGSQACNRFVMHQPSPQFALRSQLYPTCHNYYHTLPGSEIS